MKRREEEDRLANMTNWIEKDHLKTQQIVNFEHNTGKVIERNKEKQRLLELRQIADEKLNERRQRLANLLQFEDEEYMNMIRELERLRKEGERKNQEEKINWYNKYKREKDQHTRE